MPAKRAPYDKVDINWLADVVAAMQHRGDITEDGVVYLADRIGYKTNDIMPHTRASLFRDMVKAHMVKYSDPMQARLIDNG